MNSLFIKIDYWNCHIIRTGCFFALLIFTVSSAGAVPKDKKAPIITTFTSEARLKEIGAELHKKFGSNLYEDEALLSYVRSIGSELAKASEKPDIGYQFFIIDDEIVNAFAAPGGYIYITRGILKLLNSEAELAALLGHEIAHVAARHANRKGNRDVLGKSAALAAGIVTGVATRSRSAAYELENLTSLWALTASKGYSRELELEADGLSAKYLLESGYDPQAVTEMLSTLKNHQNFSRSTGSGSSYHGLFATHPKTDRRLQEMIAEVGVSENQDNQTGNEMFRKHLDGLAYRRSILTSNQDDERNRYYQELLGYTLIFPEDWEVHETTTTVTASMPNKGSIKIEVQRIQENIEPRVFIRDKMGVVNLEKSEALNHYRLLGHTGTTVSEETGNSERVAAIYFGPRVYTFRGEILDSTSADSVDALLLSSIRTFRATLEGEGPQTLSAKSQLKIKFVQASEYFDFSVVAKSSPLTEEELRYLNGYYPRGTPEAGEWVKLIE